MSKPMRGIFPVLQTPLDERGEIDIPSMERQVVFSIETGAHGLVYPVLGGELQYLSEGERAQLIEATVRAAAGRIPVVAGVAAPATPIAALFARQAASAGADAVIALPPYVTQGGPEEMYAYYRAIAEAAQRPVFIQHTTPGLNPAFMVRLLKEIPWVQYIKEEAPPSGHNISAVLAAVGDECKGVFGGAHGRWMIPEMRRGAAGFMPAAQCSDVYAAIWDAYHAGDEAGARAIWNRLAPLLELINLVGLRVCKEVLVRRGVFKTAVMRTPGSNTLDEVDRHEMEVVLQDLRPFYRGWY